MEQRRRGFTIIELIITLSLCAAIFAGSLPLIYKTITSNRKAQLRLNAYESAHQELENLRGTPVSALANKTFSVNRVPGANGQIIVNNEVEGQERTDIAKITSRVSWTFQQKAETVELNTYFYGNE